MKKFEVGKRYSDISGSSSVVFEVVARTEKTIKFVQIQHGGRFNERRSEEKKAKIHEWEKEEVFFSGDRTIIA